MDLNMICRLCAETNCTLHPIFTNNFENNIVLKIRACAPVELSMEDDLPKMMCTTCNDKLNAAYNFRLQMISTDEKLRLHISTPQLPVKKDPDNWECEEDNNLLLPMCDIKSDYNSDIEKDDSIHHESDIKSNSANESSSEYKHETEEESDVESNNGINTDKQKLLNKKTQDKRSNPAYASVCPVCGKLLKRNSFSDHMLNVHAKDANIECNVCGKMVKTKRQLWHHKKTHEKESVSCDKCGKIFTTKAGFKRHFDDIHLGIRKYGCKLCDKSFPRLMALKRHMRTHTGERPYVCSYCDRRFAGRWNLKQHIRLHTKEKPYKCTICSEAFTQNVMLKLHIRNKHTEIDEEVDSKIS